MDILGEAGRGSAKVRVESAESVGGINQPGKISVKLREESAKPRKYQPKWGRNQPTWENISQTEGGISQTEKISAKVGEESANLGKYQPK